ncbi:MAG: galactose mutarotase [Oscillospiraceae bacterium]|nr:galactose mutarotase [Oscillospiraceae bacterium]
MARIENHAGASLTVLEYGATIQSLCVPDKNGKMIDVVLGYDSTEEYASQGGCLGGSIGRFGNRIGGAKFSLNGREYPLAKNNGENHLHGGINGFHRVNWNVAENGNSIVCTRLSQDGEEGYPGNLEVRVCYTLTEDNSLIISYDADTDADTLVNLTNHSYFNLNGSGNILKHRLQLFGERVTENDAGCLPTGRLLYVKGTAFDFLTEKEIGADIDADDPQLKLAGGYDINYVLCGKKAAVLYAPESGIEMTVETDLPGMQLYTANGLGERKGKHGSVIGPRSGVCFETQLFPNAMNCYAFPSPVLRAGQHLHTETSYSFGIRS